MGSIFLSYSHNDEAWKNRLQTQLEVLQIEGLCSVWEDRQIGAGRDWELEIEKALASASVAILLVSANFLTSKFIRGKEVPALLERRSKEGLRIIPLMLLPCAWQTVPWLEAIQGRPKDNKPLSGFSEHEVEEHLCNLALEVRELLAASGGASASQGGAASGGAGAAGTQSAAANHHHEAAARKLLNDPSAAGFLQRVIEEFAEEFPGADQPTSAAEIARAFNDGEPDEVQRRFYVVRRALSILQQAGEPAAGQRSVEEAAAALYFLAACRLINRAAKASVMQVPCSERVVCAVIATALFGGELRIVAGEDPELPKPEYVFEVKPQYGGDQLVEDFDRAVFCALFENDAESTKLALDSGALGPNQASRLAARIRAIRHVRRSSMALLVHGHRETQACHGFAETHQVPVMLPATEATQVLLGMDANTLQAEVREFWAELRELPHPKEPSRPDSRNPAAGASGNAPAATPMSSTPDQPGTAVQTQDDHVPSGPSDHDTQP